MSDFQIVNKNGEVDLISPRPKSSKKTLKTSPSSAQLTPPSSEKPSLPPAPSGSLRRSTSTSASLGQKLRSSSFNASTAPAPSPAATKSLRSSSPSSKPIVKKKKVTVKLAESSSSSASSSSSSLSSRNESDLEYDPETFNKSSTPPTKIETKPKEENNKLHQALTSATSVPVLSVDFQVSSSSPSSPPEKSNASAGAISESTSPRLAIGSPPRSSSLISPRALSPSSSTSEIKSSSSSSPPSFTSAKRSTSPLATLPPVLPSILPAESTSSSSPGQNGSESSSSVHEGGELSPTSSKLNAEEAARRREKIKSLGAKKANLMDFVIDDSVPRSPRKTDSDSILTNSKRKLSSSANLLNYGSLGNLPSSSSSSSSSASSSPTSEGKTPRKRHHKSGLKEEESLLSSSPSSSNLASMGPSSPPVAESLKEALADPNIKWGRSAETQMIIDMLKSEALRINNPTPTTNTIEVQRKEEVPDVSLLSSSYSMSSLSELSSSGEDNLRRSEKRRSSQHRRSVILKMKKNKDFVITRNEDSFDNASTPALELSGTPRRGSDNAVIVDRRSQIAEEILSTEKHYVHTLDVMMEKYQKPILEELKNNDTLDVNKVEVRQIFGNLNTILNVNNQLLRDLTTRMENWNEEETCLGDLFLDFAPYFRMYNQYANQYDEAQTILSHNLKKPNFNDLLLRLDETTDLAPRLEGLLIAPIQRIPRYLLLLTDMLRHTPETHKDYELLNQAIPLMQSVADYINREIKQAANMKKFMELSSQGAKALLKPHRLLIYDGLLTDDKKNKFHFWLFNDIFVHVPEKKAIKKSNLEKPQYQWPLHLVWVRFDTKKETMEVLGPSAMYKMKPTNEESALWRLHFAKALTDHFEFLKTTHDRELQKEKEVEMSMSNAQRFGSYDFPSGAHYSGWWLNGKMEGHGYWTFNGTYYNGSFVANEKHGVGEMTYFGSETYTGTFEHDRPHGKGVLRYPNGDVYDGEWKNGRKSGTGVLTCVSGDTYEGNWSDDQPEGMGKMRYSNGAVYKGNWQNGLRQGYGVLKIKDYMRYEGMWSAGLRNGKGISSYIDGSQYVGSWREGLREGNGMYSSVHGKYEGDWLEDAMEGKGRFEFVNGNVYEGFWKRNLFNGQGKLIFASGIYKQYEGEWINGKKNGTGVLLFTNGDKFEGTFKDDQMHGNGEYVYANTSKITGRWVKGQLDGKCTARGALAIHTKVNGIAKDNVITSSDSTILGFHSFPTIQFGTDW